MLLCANAIQKHRVPQRMVTEALTHELIHAFDACRAKVNWLDCYHIACSEVRAANLSNDCTLMNELRRSNFRFKGQGGKCIRRRAELSVSSHPQCKDITKKAVETVFDVCTDDISPFLTK